MQKLAALLAGTLLIVPLVYYDYYLPMALYVGLLLLLHFVFFVLYIFRTPWIDIVRHKTEFALRVVAVIFFIYLLSLVKFEGGKMVVIMNIVVALGIHVLILAALMIVRRSPVSSE